MGFGSEYTDENGVHQIRHYDFAVELLDQKVKEICGEVWADEAPILFLTNDKKLNGTLNKRRKRNGEEEHPYIPNFREAISKKKVYKGTRKGEKPFHFDNLTIYMLDNYTTIVAEGLEADDMMSVYQCARLDKADTVICSRDKDLRITPGLHFGWPCGKQPQFGPVVIDELGYIEVVKGKIKGGGLKFFYSQILTGDTVDNIPGLEGCGPVKAFKLLNECGSEEELFKATSEAYKAKYGEDIWRDDMLEQALLVWMVRDIDDDGKPVMWTMYDERGVLYGKTIGR